MLSRIVYSKLIAILFLVYHVASAPKCDENDFMWCLEELNLLENIQYLQFPKTEQELSKTCSLLQGFIKCVNNFTGRCFDTAQLEMYRTLSKGKVQLLEDLCTRDSDFRKQYLEHASCIQTLSADYLLCADKYLLQQDLSKMYDMNVKDRLRESCCLLAGYKECTRQVVTLKCSKEAADLDDQFVSKSAGPLVQTHCANFKHYSKDCLYPYVLSSARYSIVSPASYVINSLISLILSAALHFCRSYR